MWALDNRTPYAAERTWVRDRDGAHQWIVVVKGTWQIADDGALTLADEQLPPLYAAEYNGEPGQSSIRYEADLLGMKPGTDVTLLGSAHVPGGRAASSVEVGLQVGPITKRLMVVGPRVYERGVVGAVASAHGVYRLLAVLGGVGITGVGAAPGELPADRLLDEGLGGARA